MGRSSVPVGPQAADVPLVELGELDAEEAEAAGFDSAPDEAGVDEEPDAFAGDVAGVLLDEEPRLSFR
ncbi:hypothetical protein GCM10010327_33890 [Streptomyces nitrosporeus]|nr:hypothetical protein GCM10010327_33890 [Streptomyces nitrosporeus]